VQVSHLKSIEFEGSNLILNGTGTRVVFFMKVYEGSLYLETKSSDADEIINSNSNQWLSD
jgi:hypothetical protein